jgi:hypothetical protein
MEYSNSRSPPFDGWGIGARMVILRKKNQISQAMQKAYIGG